MTIVRTTDTHLILQAEEVKGGGLNLTGASIGTPLASNGLTVREIPHFTKPKTNTAGYRQRKRQLFGVTYLGVVNTILWPESAKLLMQWATDRSNGDLPTLAAHIIDPNDEREYRGVMIDVLRVSGTTDGQPVAVALQFKAMSGGTAGHVDAPTYGSSVGFIFERGAITAGSAVLNAESWAIVISNNVKEGPFGSNKRPTTIAAGLEDVSAQMVVWYEDARYAAAIRSGADMRFRVALTHSATAVNGVVAFEMPTAKVTDAPVVLQDEGGAKQQVTLEGHAGGTAGQLIVTVGDIEQ